MKQPKIFLCLCMFCLFVTGCGLDSSPNDQSNAGGANTDMKETKLDFKIIPVSDLPESLQTKANELVMSKNGGNFTAFSDQKTFIVIALGERRTGGYSIDVEKVIQKGSKLTVSAKEEAPPKGSFVTQAITYPSIVVVVKGGPFDPIEIDLKRAPSTDSGETQ
ncbi:protease complex subunit PrcB family protein [Hazenella coriacea]|uniref:Protease stability complex PrcB-like protein n=1 Tax=Hazenella coriacea TaxID=1179467 RepID=A0A4V2UVA6_9BACL|nr:protease complex subunit PrcB family protein [Hazenella coriacea]TCS95017.1 protease stability complex PrcB-like protein [Hazenella coriacea]